MLYGIAFTSLLCGMKVTANNCLSNSVWPEKCKTRCSFLELQMGHQRRNRANCIQAWYTPGLKNKAIRINIIRQCQSHLLSGIFAWILQVHLVLTPGWGCFLQKKPWLPHLHLLQQELQIWAFVLRDNQLCWSFLRKLPRQKVPHGTTDLQYYFPVPRFHSAKRNFISSGINAKLD